ncbi:DUF2213 domain-containing protein [Jiella sonneratiae]|uniref:DUF2213 domain-containing protein n=1 Tax=Jiella sonneratiae TaxID=2816856 RepID=A0ABS3J2C2_9HYPH|nr:DUF2213 domain-containing protein [Jiella sonneratiae]MBO0903807.1 DUF2213 domain-containing protein [Jiella sonneratiae]
MLFLDAAPIDDWRISRDGYLVADVRIARAGIYQYAGRELGRADLGMVNVYRPPAAVFDARAMRSFALRPVTMDHPATGVSAATWRQHAIGTLGEEIRRDGIFLRGTAIIHDGAAIETIRAGKRELSAGYVSSLTWQDTATPEGERAQAVMGGITGNHVAVVERGRAGAQCRIGQ